MVKCKNTRLRTLIEACATIKVTRHAATEAARHSYANDRHAFCVVFNTCYKWALIKNRLLEQLFYLALYTSISENYISYIYSCNSHFYTIVIHTNDKYGVLLKHSNKTHKIDHTSRACSHEHVLFTLYCTMHVKQNVLFTLYCSDGLPTLQL